MRNFAKDREICNAATPGPWRWSRNRWQLQNPETEAEILFAESAAMLKKHWDVSDPGIQEWRPSKSDAKFIAKARTGWPAALDRIAELEAENARLRTRLLSAAGDDLCRLTQDEIKELTSGAVKIPPKEEFLASCERFHQQIASGPGVLNNCLTLAQLIAENAKLEAENARLKEQLERWNAAKSSTNTTLSLPPTTGANSSS